ncbi:ABC transporter permease [Agrococcus jejuensis]|uniref:ABC-2 type transport system permease protein n=1 Tax=Agrococcus jejuensis TaxID=399736 RepID=A0A1G8EAB1_9MICO|nr:ABC transporter permease [Agrococcus jejuensis]SDH66872.1 ABC-2 type transport system permease protein [Agrococcus jejuensis]
MSTASPTGHVHAASRVPFWRAVGIVAQREIMVNLRSKAYLISAAIVLLGALAAVIFSSVGPQLFQSTTTVAVVAETEDAVADLPDTEVTVVDDADAARDLVAAEEVDAAVLPSDDPSGIVVVGEREAPEGLIAALSLSPDVELLDPSAPNPGILYLISLGFGLVFMMASMSFGYGIAGSVVEEKQTRIVEILLASVPARALLAGKIIGNSLLAFVQIALIAAVVLIGGAATDNAVIVDGLGTPIAWFVLLFTVGFVLMASLFAAAAAMVSRSEDLGSTTGPIMMLVMIPYFAIILFNSNPLALQIMSYVPFSAPVAVPMRAYLGAMEWWEGLLSFGIVLATTALVVTFAGRVYERSLLRTGKPVKLREALRWPTPRS